MRCLERIVASGAPGVIAEVRHGSDVWRGAAGVADLETRRARRVDEHFRIGSVTKTFTATVVLQLVAEGLVDLDSCRRLLNHTSGIFDYGEDPRFLADFTGPAYLSTARYRTYPRLAPSRPSSVRCWPGGCCRRTSRSRCRPPASMAWASCTGACPTAQTSGVTTA